MVPDSTDVYGMTVVLVVVVVCTGLKRKHKLNVTDENTVVTICTGLKHRLVGLPLYLAG